MGEWAQRFVSTLPKLAPLLLLYERGMGILSPNNGHAKWKNRSLPLGVEIPWISPDDEVLERVNFLFSTI